MRIEIDTKEDSHEDIKKAINLLHSLMGESVDTNFSAEQTESPIASIFGDSAQIQTNSIQVSEPTAIVREEAQEEKKEESTEDLFAELFTDDEISKMKKIEEEDEKPSRGKKRPSVELY